MSANAARCFSCARTATVDSAIAVQIAAQKPGGSNAVLPTAGTSGVQKVDSITETDNAPTASVTQLTP